MNLIGFISFCFKAENHNYFNVLIFIMTHLNLKWNEMTLI